MPAPCQCDSCKKTRTNDAVTASGFFSVEQLGPNQSFTPEGFLLCEAVPIARTGTQDYAAIELPDIEDVDGVIEVDRDEDVVFSPDTIASFLGKPITLDHPNSPVTPDNWQYLAKGSAHNIRRGEGDQSNLLIADLLVTDKGAINEIRNNGLKEISCGYDSDYEQIAPGRARQSTIVGNHVALVKNARCGPVCSVQDSSKLLGDQPMAVKKGTTSFVDKLRKAFMTRDADEFEKAVGEMKDEDGMEKNVPDIHIHMPGAEKQSADESTKDEEIKPEDDPDRKLSEVLSKFDARLTSLESAIGELKSGKTKDSDEEKKGETEDDAPEDEDDPDADPDTNDSEPDDKEGKKSTNDSASLRDEFQDAKARAEILAPGVKLPTFDAKLDAKKTSDAICVLRRRALRTALTNDNASLVKSIVGNADVSKMPCGITAMAFNAASELVKQKNMTTKTSTHDSKPEPKKDLNQIHAEFWSTRK